MKKLFLTTALALATVVSYGQGTVTFANASTQYSPADNTHLVRWADTAGLEFNSALTAGGLVSSNFGGIAMPGLRAQLYFGASTATDLSSLVPVTSAPATFRASTSAQAGSWLGGPRTLANGATSFAPGDAVKLAVVVWDSAVAADPIQTTRGLLWGTSGLFNFTAPAIGAPVSAGFMFNQPAFTVGFVPVPEPSTMALAGLAAAGLLIFRRRK